MRVPSAKLGFVQEAVSLDAPDQKRRTKLREVVRASAPTLVEGGLAALSAALLVFSFPDFNLWPLAWIGLVPLMVAIARRPRARQAFLLGWLTGALFFYGSCWWLTYSMIRYGGIPRPLAFLLLVPLILIVALFPALWSLALARICMRWGTRALLLAPILWVAQEWARLQATGQLWNAIGYAQAYVPSSIQVARWGGVYAVGFLLLTVNASVASVFVWRSRRSFAVAAAAIVFVALALSVSTRSDSAPESSAPSAVVVGVQPNVEVNFGRSEDENAVLVNRHLGLSESALREWEQQHARALITHDARAAQTAMADASARRSLPRVVVWPESPMNFTYAQDAQFRQIVARFASSVQASVLFNSLEPAPGGGAYNSAVMIDEAGRLVAQYDKIRLLPFGEYVPLPRWFPGAWLLSGIVGDFTPGTEYALMPLGEARAGVFICFESAFPSIARRFTAEGADVLINISNDGYLGPTPVLRQHLANAVFRAVENDRPVLRVTNTGISAYISPRGEVRDETKSFRADTRAWIVSRATGGKTFYTKHGDLFAALCAFISVLLLALTLKRPTSGDQRSNA